MLAITHQRLCPLYGSCRYPNSQSHFFLQSNLPCSQNDQCEVETASAMESILYTLDRARQVERNVGRFVLPRHCGCRRCQLGYHELCYAKRGPDQELRSIFWERWRLQQLRDAQANARKIPTTPLSRWLAEELRKNQA